MPCHKRRIGTFFCHKQLIDLPWNGIRLFRQATCYFYHLPSLANSQVFATRAHKIPRFDGPHTHTYPRYLHRNLATRDADPLLFREDVMNTRYLAAGCHCTSGASDTVLFSTNYLLFRSASHAQISTFERNKKGVFCNTAQQGYEDKYFLQLSLAHVIIGISASFLFWLLSLLKAFA